MDFMKHLAPRLDFGVGMTPTMDTAMEWSRRMPRSWIYDGFDQTKVEDMIAAQKRALAAGREPKNLFLLMDDCLYDKRVLKSVAMRELLLNGRHLRIHLSCAVQYLMDMGPDVRTNIDYCVCTADKIIANKQKLHKYFFGMFERYQDFAKVFDKCTHNFSAIVMDNTCKTGNIEDSVFWYRAEKDVGDYKLGKPIYWQLSEQHALTAEEVRQEEEEAQDDVRRKSSKPMVVSVQHRAEMGRVHRACGCCAANNNRSVVGFDPAATKLSQIRPEATAELPRANHVHRKRRRRCAAQFMRQIEQVAPDALKQVEPVPMPGQRGQRDEQARAR